MSVNIAFVYGFPLVYFDPSCCRASQQTEWCRGGVFKAMHCRQRIWASDLKCDLKLHHIFMVGFAQAIWKGCWETSLVSSVTRFGVISPLRQNLKSFCQFFKSYFSISHIFEPILTNFVCLLVNFHSCKWPYIEK